MMMIAERRKEERSGIHDFHSKWETKTTVIFVNQTIEHVYVCVCEQCIYAWFRSFYVLICLTVCILIRISDALLDI